jgi:hypothetical protein
VSTIFTANNAEVYQQHMGRWSQHLAIIFTDFGVLLTGTFVGKSDARADAPNNPTAAMLARKSIFTDVP